MSGDPRTNNEFERIRDVYLEMAREANYRPAAPGDGLGSVQLTDEELKNPAILKAEAEKYAAGFIDEEDGGGFHIGVSNYQTNQVLVLVIEAARLLCAAEDQRALKLLDLGVAKLRAIAR